MSEPGSISVWIEQYKAGVPEAAQPLWERYYDRLVAMARKKIGDAPRRANDEEDVVQSAFNSFFLRAREGKFPLLSDRDDLWRLLVVITARKAINHRAHQRRAKRGRGVVRDQAALNGFDADQDGIANVIGMEPTPEFAAQVAEELRRVMGALPDPSHRVIALWKLEGRTNPEIGRHLDCSLSAVERKLRLIRQQLESEIAIGDDGGRNE